MTTWRSRLRGFFLEPGSPAPLAALRIGLSLTLLLQAAYLSFHLNELYGSGALLEKRTAAVASDWGLDVSSWNHLFSLVGVPEASSLILLCLLYVGALLALLVGWNTRVSAIFAWFFHLILMDDQMAIYGTDFLSHSVLFFLLWMPSGEVWSVDARRQVGGPSWQARLSLRAFQIYLCIVYLASGLEKINGTQWWSGEAIWRSLMLPSLAQFDMAWIAAWPLLPRTLGWGTLLVETAYPLFIWPRRTRLLWVALTVSLHVGIALFLGLWLFSLLMIVLTVCGFAVPYLVEAKRVEMRKPDEARLRRASSDENYSRTTSAAI